MSKNRKDNRARIYWGFVGLTVVLASGTLIAQDAESDYGEYKASTFSAEPVLVNWYSEEGRARLARSDEAQDFYQLAHFFQPQINPLYCGIASSVIVLNAMRIPDAEAPSQEGLEVKRPKVWGGTASPYPSFSQVTFLNEETDRVKPKAVIELKNVTKENTNDAAAFDPGLSLAQLKGVLEIYDAKVEMNYAADDPEKGVARFRASLQESMKDDTSFLVANFVGRTLGAKTGGHISPVAAYDEKTDSLLLLDVAGHKQPWHWIPVREFYRAMHTKDGKTYRGWLVVRDGLDQP